MPDLRFTPPSKLRIADRASGLNSGSVRSYNERLMLSLLLQHEGLSRQALCEKTGLSGQSVSVLLRSLEQEGLVRKTRAPRERGRLGPPTLPAELNPSGAFSIGLAPVRDGVGLLVMNLVGETIFRETLPGAILGRDGEDRLVERLDAALVHVPDGARDRFAGIGVAIPSEPAGRGAASDIDVGVDRALREALEARLGTIVYTQHDVDAACAAESMYGAARALSNYLFIHLGPDLQGRLVLDHRIHAGATLGRLGPGLDALPGAPVDGADCGPPEAAAARLIAEPMSAAWCRDVAERVAETTHGLLRFVSFDRVFLSSSAPDWLCEPLAADIAARLDGPTLMQSRIGPLAVLVGAASLPMADRFMTE